MDVIRAVYNRIWLGLGLTNRYRYEQYIYRPDFIYDFERLKMAMNVQQYDNRDYLNNWIVIVEYYLDQIQNYIG